ncbi:GTP-binding protein [Candidatus Chloroploca sp. Khr17]|uniref:CobW family GTP-binding protein n=1 Tax=Candidatus Chloroploca sp. Khr17 TaxID=2496869 RepID=UPI00101B73C4|nr:GTP-binding protein [Candidatus Chloroploca sp. Khr17]
MQTPLTLVTGFLGSGKTTLVRRLVAEASTRRRLGVIVNEFGQIGLDGATLARSGHAPIVELAGGCVCCEAGSDFLLAVEELLDYHPDQILVETSGLAEPGGLVRRIRAAELPLDAIVTVVDATNFAAALAASPVTTWQLQAADLIILNKTDLISTERCKQVSEEVQRINARAALVPTVQGLVPADLLFSLRMEGEDPPAYAGHRTQDGFSALSWSNDTPLIRSAFEQTLASLPERVYRAKGLVHCTDAPWPNEVHHVFGRHSLTSVRPRQHQQPLNRLILIGPDLEPLAAQIFANLDRCADAPERANHWRQRYDELLDQ